MPLANGLAFVEGQPLEVALEEIEINFSSSGDNIIVSAVPNQAVYVFKYFLVVASATNLIFKDGSTALTGAIDMVANGSIVFDFDTRPWFSTSIGNAFVINSSNAVQVGGRLYYLQV